MNDEMTAEVSSPAVGFPLHGLVMRPAPERAVAALYVEPQGCYVGMPGVDPWDEARDARQYAGPHPVVAHPPCQRWGRFWHGSTRKPHQFKLGDDGGCFRAALDAVKRWGGVLEHPAHSRAWDVYALRKPGTGAGWQWDMLHKVWVCYVELGQGGAAPAGLDDRALRLRESQAYRSGGDGGRQEQDIDQKRDTAGIPRSAAFDCAQGA